MQSAEGLGDGPAAVRGKVAELAGGGADLLALLRAEAFHGFRALNQALALLRVHGVELGETIAHALLLLWGKLVEAALLLEGTLLLVQREITVSLHPGTEMLLGLAGTVWGDELILVTCCSRLAG